MWVNFYLTHPLTLYERTKCFFDISRLSCPFSHPFVIFLCTFYDRWTKPSTLYEQLRHLPYPPTYPKSMRTLWTHPFVLNQRSGTYGSRARYGSFQDSIWLSDSETTLSRHFFNALKNSEYLQKSFPKLVLASNSGVIARQSIGQVNVESNSFAFPYETNTKLYGS